MPKNNNSPVPFINYNENEKTTVIESITFLRYRPSWLSCIVVLILTLLTGSMFGLLLYWSTKWRHKVLYKKVEKIQQATHVLVEGKEPKGLEICELEVFSQKGRIVCDCFQFRFIRFRYDFQKKMFKPLVFNTKMTHADILSKYSKGLDYA